MEPTVPLAVYEARVKELEIERDRARKDYERMGNERGAEKRALDNVIEILADKLRG